MAPAFGSPVPFLGNDKSLFGIILGVVTFWLFAQTTLNIAPDMGKDLGLDASTMNVAVIGAAAQHEPRRCTLWVALAMTTLPLTIMW
jgi:hypothetical protein